MKKTISTAMIWAATSAAVWAGTPVPPPAVESDNGNEGLLLLVLVGAVIFAVAKGKAKSADQGAPDIVDAEDGAGNGKY